MPMLTRQFVSHVTLRRDTITTFDAYPFNLPAVRALDTLALHLVSQMDEVLKIALDGPLTPIPPTPDADFEESSDATTH